MSRAATQAGLLAGARVRTIGQAITRNGASISEASRRIGIDASYLSRLLKGQRVSVGEQVVESVCTTFGIDASYFSDRPQDEDLDYGPYLLANGVSARRNPAGQALQVCIGALDPLTDTERTRVFDSLAVLYRAGET